MEDRKNNHHQVGTRILFSRVTGGEELEVQRRQENDGVGADDQKGRCFRCHLGSGKNPNGVVKPFAVKGFCGDTKFPKESKVNQVKIFYYIKD